MLYRRLNWLALALTVAIAIGSLGLIQSSQAIAPRLVTMSSQAPPTSGVHQLVKRQARAWENADAATIVADFAEDALFIVPGFRFEGRQAIKQAAEDYFAQFTDTTVTIKRIIAQENEGAIEWIWSDVNRETSQRTKADDAIIFELQNGKITYWREYIDKTPQVPQ